MMDNLLERFKKFDIVLPISLTFYSYLCYNFFWFTLDDAYITLRYGKNFVEVGEPLWNLTGNPVEGYTSTLWMLISIIPHYIGLNAVNFVKILGFLCGFILIATIYLYSLRDNSNRILGLICISVLTLSSEFAVVSIQGMETTLAMLLVVFVCIISCEIVDRRGTIRLHLLYSFLLFLCMITRPDLVVFSIVLTLTILLYLYKTGQEYISFLIANSVISGVLGVLFMISRYLYFGYPFPNSFYVKSGGSSQSLGYIFKFLIHTAGPILFILALVSIIYFLHNEDKNLVMILSDYILLPSIIVFIFFMMFIDPIQGFFSRFLLPIYSVMSIQLLRVSNTISFKSYILDSIDKFQTESPISILHLCLIIVVVGMSFGWYFAIPSDTYEENSNLEMDNPIKLIEGQPVDTYEDANYQTNRRTQYDRVVVGKSLSKFENQGYTMYVTESGALPYFSNWRAIDDLGLNNESIAHEKLSSKEIIRNQRPELLMSLSAQDGIGLDPIDSHFLENLGYKTVTHINKSSESKNIHYYFIHEDVNKKNEIACSIKNHRNINYINRSDLQVEVPDYLKTNC